MTKTAPPFLCPKCGKEVSYVYDARTEQYTPATCSNPVCSQMYSAKVN